MGDVFGKYVVEHSPEAFAYFKLICGTDESAVDFEFIELNLAFAKLFRLKRENVIGHRATEVLPVQIFEEFDWVSFFERVATQGISADIKQYFRGLDRWFHIQAYSPEKYCFITHIREITAEMKRLEEQETINAAFKDVVFVLNEQYEFVNVYTADDCYLFKPREDIIGKSIHDVVDGELAKEFVGALERAFDSGERQYIEYALPLSGSQWWYQAEVMYRESLEHDNRYVVVARDHSKKKRLERELTASALQLEKFFSVNLDLLCIADVEGNFVKVNKEWENVLGFTIQELEQMKLINFVHPRDRAATLAALKKLGMQEQVLNFVNRMLGKNGTYRFIEWRCHPSGNIFYAAARDITDKIRKQEELRRSEDDLKDAHALARMGRWELDLTTDYLSWSEGIYEIFEVNPDDFAASYEAFLSFVHPEDRDAVDEAFSQSVKNQTPYEFTHRLLMPGGRVKWVNEVGRTEYDDEGKPLRSYGTVQDITKLKLAQQVLYEEKERLRVTLRSIGDAVITTDKHGCVTNLNTVAEQLTGWALEEAYGRPLQDVFQVVHSTTRKEFENPVQKVLSSGEIYELDSDTLLIARDGREVHIADSAAPIKDDSGYILGVVLVFRDTSAEQQKLDRIAYLSYHDSLTGLYNRRYFEEQLERLDTARNLPLSIIVGDVNGLKLTNDAFGHLIGDELLKQAAAIMQDVCRADDIIARWGGDEFVIILPKATKADAGQIIKRIKEASAQVELVPINLSISFGCQTKVSPETDVMDILKGAEDDMYKEKLLESQQLVADIIVKIVDTLHVSNPREKMHAEKVGELSMLIGKALGLPKGKIKELEKAGYFHDIGKINIPGSILNKRSALTADEWREIKRHPEVGFRILSSYNETSELAENVLAHHERIDGSGYPKGLLGKDIPLASKIIAVADAFDTMTGAGHYKKPIPVQEAARELKAKAGTQFDRHIVQVFLDKVLNKVSWSK